MFKQWPLFHLGSKLPSSLKLQVVRVPAVSVQEVKDLTTTTGSLWLSGCAMVCLSNASKGFPRGSQGVPKGFPRDSQGIPKLLKRFDGLNGFFPQEMQKKNAFSVEAKLIDACHDACPEHHSRLDNFGCGARMGL